nr:glycosyltransferase [Aromatoleum diolicum]
MFIAEAVTLAHVARPYALARGLDAADWEIVFACADTYLALFPDWPWQRVDLQSIAPQVFMRRLAQGHRLYPRETLEQYAREDLRLIDTLRPDVIVGDFRLSLSATARAARVPYVALTNAYWSPYATRRRIPVPSLPMTRALGVPLASALFTLSRPLAFAWHTLPLNSLRREYGQPSLGFDLRRAYTDADITLYADIPQLVPTSGLPAHHRYIGPVEWSPPIPMPELPRQQTADKPFVYVTMGSSGSATLLPTILSALSGLDCQIAVATGGIRIHDAPANAIVADYLPGDRMADCARLVICNGGSPTSHQALARGVPVLGIPSNLDQHLNMEYVTAYGAGLSLRPESATVQRLQEAIRTLLHAPEYRRRAGDLANIMREQNPAGALAGTITEILELHS